MMSRLTEVPGRLYRGEVSIDFVGKRKMWYMISAVILIVSIAALIIRGLAFSVEFKGGADFLISKAPASVTQVEVQDAAASAGYSDAIVQHVGQGGQATWQVQTTTLTEAETTSVQATLADKLDVPLGNINVTSVGASWGGQITTKAVQALIAFLVVIVIYLTIAFEWRMAASAFVALLHTLVITVGVYALSGISVSPATVIGFLTILGYALYDTVVVFDKVRENTAGLLGGARSTYSQAANLALNQTLVRSINTSLIALLPVGAILFVGGYRLGVGELKDLSLVLFVGILAGAYASICVATPVLAQLKEREPQYQALAKRIATRSTGGRAAQRAAAKAQSGSRGGTATKVVSSGEGPVDDLAADDDPAAYDPTAYDPAAYDPTGDDLAPDADSADDGGSGPAQSSYVTRSVGPRQQPRRDGRSTAARRPAGKKKRR
jgi:preprotein translocase subunit SecF